MKYLIKTPGRTGSHIITSYLNNNNIEHVHCQEVWIPDDPTNWVFINNKRHNWWDMVCSRVVTSHTKEYGPYTSQELSITTDIEYLLNSFAYTKFRYDLHDAQQNNYNWGKSVTIYHEDMLDDINTLKQIGDFDTSAALSGYYTSPYMFSDVIVDYDNLKIEFENIIKDLV